MFEWFRKKRAQKPAVNLEEVPRYPPLPLGVPATPVDLIMESQRELLARIYDSIGLALDEDEQFIKPLIRRYCEYVHLLPASQAHHHRGSGGLFRHGMEVGLGAARKSRNYVYGMEYEPQVRRRVKVKWRVGMFVAGLCHDLGKPVTDLRVTDKAGDRVWSPLSESLAHWGESNGIERYFLHWTKGRHGKHEALSARVLSQVMSDELSQWIGADGMEVLEFIYQAISGMNPQDRNVRLVIEADQQSVERDLSENQIDPYSLALGVPVEQHLIDAMRRLTRAEEWTVNRPGARIWTFDGQVHLVWPGAAEDIIATLAGDKVNGIPKSPKILADILIDRKLAIARPVPDSLPQRFWRIAPAALERDGRRIALNMLRLAPECKLFPGLFPESVGYALVALTEDGHTEFELDRTRHAESGRADAETGSGASRASVQSNAGGEPAGRGPGSPSPGVSSQAATGSPTANATHPAQPAVGVRTPDAAKQDHRGSATPERALCTEREPQFTPSQARDWLASSGRAGQILSVLVGLSAVHFDSEGYAMVGYPDEFESVAIEPLDAVMALENERMLVHDKVNPLRKVHQRDGRRVIILIETVSRRLSALCPSAEGGAAAMSARGSRSCERGH